MNTNSRLAHLWSKAPHWLRSVLTVAAVLTALDLFFVAIKLLSAFKAFGSGYGHDLVVEMAGNPLIGLLIGILVTSIVQSSSSTTSLVVGLVAAGALGKDPETAVCIAVPVIMGANIGTSVTNILVSFGHIGDKKEFERAFSAATVHDFFNLLAVVVLLPIQAATNFLGVLSLKGANALSDVGGLKFVSPLKLLVEPQKAAIKGIVETPAAATFIIASVCGLVFFYMVKKISKLSIADKPVNTYLFGFGLIFAGVVTAMSHVRGLFESSELALLLMALTGLFGSLYVMVRIMRVVVMSRIEKLFHNYIFKTAVRAFVLGMVFTALVQSSSVTTSLIVPLAGAGLLNLTQIFPYTLGANVGTTVTAMLAALSLGEPAAVAVANAHFLFNAIGIIIWYPFKRVPIGLAQRMAALSVRFPALAPLFVLGVFFFLPLALILIVR